MMPVSSHASATLHHDVNNIVAYLLIDQISCTGCVAQWLERQNVKRFSSRYMGSNPTVSHSNGLNQTTHGTMFQSTQLLTSTGPRAWG